METRDINNLIEDLNKRVDYWVDNRSLFCGGCCFAAAVLAKGLERLGVKYTVVCFQDNMGLNCRKLNTLCKNPGCAHVAISVVYKHKKTYIGKVDRLVECLNDDMKWGGEWRTREYRKISSDVLLENYWSNDWNWTWDIMLNDRFEKEINKIFEKYLDI